MIKRLLLVLTLAHTVGCVAEVGYDEPDFHGEDPEAADGLGRSSSELSLSSISRGCTTAGVEGLSRQLIDEMLCLSGGAMVRVEHPNIVLTSTRVHPYLSPRGREMLLAAAAGGRIEINSAFRSLAEQYVLSRGCSVAAAPGRSNHETGRAIDVNNYGVAGSRLIRAGFTRPLPTSDPVHYEAPGTDLRNLSVRAFQRLWNANNPRDRIAEDGVAGPATLSRLGRSPGEGFAIGSVCDAAPPTPPPTPTPTPMPPPPTGRACTHTFGGAYGHLACSESYQCCDGAWRMRSSACGTCTCVEPTGRSGCR
jgi:hypothetical protein